MGKYIRTEFTSFIVESQTNEELDYDKIAELMKDHGWGDLGTERYDDFENSSYFKGAATEEQYAEQFHKYMYALSIGDKD